MDEKVATSFKSQSYKATTSCDFNNGQFAHKLK